MTESEAWLSHISDISNTSEKKKKKSITSGQPGKADEMVD